MEVLAQVAADPTVQHDVANAVIVLLQLFVAVLLAQHTHSQSSPPTDTAS